MGFVSIASKVLIVAIISEIFIIAIGLCMYREGTLMQPDGIPLCIL